jgi:predicted RNA-binding Zn ribbon-like protein
MGLEEPTFEAQDALRRARASRETLRALAWANAARETDLAAIDALNADFAHLGLHPMLLPDGTITWEAAVRSYGGFEVVLGAVASAIAAGAWKRLKRCANPACGWVFYDHSRNQSGTWCTMSICGNRAKKHSFRTR